VIILNVMENSVRVPLVRSAQSIVAAVAALLVTLFLFYIDEGYYNFRWMMNDLRNWLWFAVYVAAIWGIQLLAGKYVYRKYAEWEKIILNVVLAVPAGVILVISLLIGLAKLVALFS
jgi:hypothetical protein